MSYSDWGFAANPFETSPLPASDFGSRLLVGRDEIVKGIGRRLDSSSKIVTVEGLNGVGKTSVINVAIFRAMKESIKTGIGPLYIPCRVHFQLDDVRDSESLRFRVLAEVAQTLIERHKEIPPQGGCVTNKNRNSLDRWLNSPQIAGFNGSILQVGLGFSQEPNTSQGFEVSGFEKYVTNWLEELFPTSTSGAVVCVLDNLELLQTSQRAREVIEGLRDTLFNIRGIRWILCGAQGIIHGVASSPRLDGRLHKPITVSDLDERFAGDVFDSRVKAYRSDIHCSLPITRSQFIEVFDIMRGNLRSALSECDDFCMWVSDSVDDRDEFYPEMFEEWLEYELEAAFSAVRAELRPRALEVFETACQLEVFSPGDCAIFGYSKPSAMRPQIKNLEAVGLLQSAIDEDDKRRKSIQVTSKGWKVRAFLDFNDTFFDE